MEAIEFKSGMSTPWNPLNDGVMGGLSEGQTTFTDSTMLVTHVLHMLSIHSSLRIFVFASQHRRLR